MLAILEDAEQGTLSGLEAVTSAATEAFQREVEKAYHRGYQDALGYARSYLSSKLDELGAAIGPHKSVERSSPASAASSRSHPARKAAKTRAKPGEIGRGVDELFQDGQGRTIKEAHDALIAAGGVASREGVARELRSNRAKYRQDGKRYFLLASDSGENPGAGAPGIPATSTT